MVKLALHSIAYEAKTLNLSKEGYTAFYVDGADGLDIHDGGSWAQAFKTIQHAIDEAGSWCRIFIKSKNSSSVNATAAAAQKDVIVVDTSGFSAGDKVIVRRDNFYTEIHVIDSISGVTLTMVSDLGNEFTNVACTVIAYYDETVVTPAALDGITIIGESKSTTVVSSPTGHPITIASDNLTISNISPVVGVATKSAIYVTGEAVVIDDCSVDGTNLATTSGITLSESGYGIIKNSQTATPRLTYGVYLLADNNEVHGCTIDGTTTGIHFQYSNSNKVYDNEILNCATGLYCLSTSNDNSIFHNIFDTNTAQLYSVPTLGTNRLFENFFSNHTTDANNDGMADTAYTENDATDYQPVSSRDRWRQESLPVIGSGGDATEAKQDIIIADTEKIYDVALGGSPTVGALASFIATGGTALGSNLAASKSIIDALGHDGTSDLNSGIMGQLQDYVTDDAASIYGRLGAFTGPVGGAAQNDNVKASLDLAHTDLDTIIAAQTVGIKKNVQRTIVFKMVDSTDFATPEPSITVTEERSLDGAAFAACTNAATEIGGAGNGCGWYKITLTAAEMNANEIVFKGTGAGCAQCDRLIITEA